MPWLHKSAGGARGVPWQRHQQCTYEGTQQFCTCQLTNQQRERSLCRVKKANMFKELVIWSKDEQKRLHLWSQKFMFPLRYPTTFFMWGGDGKQHGVCVRCLKWNTRNTGQWLRALLFTLALNAHRSNV